MEELIQVLAIFFIVGAIIIFILWIVAAIAVRVLSYVIVYWALLFVLSVVAGVVAGIVLPVRVLVGKARGRHWQIVPQDLVEGRVVGEKPKGPNREHGWDHAWPNYMPYQVREDAAAVGREVTGHVSAVLSWVKSRQSQAGEWWHSSTTTKSRGKTQEKSAEITGQALGFLGWVLVGPALLGYGAGLYVSAAAWFVVMGFLGVLLTIVERVGLVLMKFGDVIARRRHRASMKCTTCYGTSTLPGYRCSADGCSRIHWTMLPGPLGLRTRRCECGQQLPNTIRSAARKLQPVCPYCRCDLVAGSGARQTIQIAVVGSIGAGKSRLLDAIVVELEKVLTHVGGSLTPLNDEARDHRDQAQVRLAQQAVSSKTQYERPVGLPFALTRGSTTIEAQVLDVAGEAYSNWDETAKLRYLDGANGLILALDPLALPEVHEVFLRSPFASSVLLASGDQEEAYASAIDRMRADQVRTDKRGLAVVLTKGDVLTRLPIGASLHTGDSAAIRQWLVEHGADLVVRRFEKDFREVRYFLADSMQPRELHDPLNPWWTMDWLLEEYRAPLKLGAAISAPEAPAAPEPANA